MRHDVAHVEEIGALAAGPGLVIERGGRLAHRGDDGEGLVALLAGVRVDYYPRVVVGVELRDDVVGEEAGGHLADGACVGEHAGDVVDVRDLVGELGLGAWVTAGDEQDYGLALAEGVVYELGVRAVADAGVGVPMP